jgi:hypothetical protein
MVLLTGLLLIDELSAFACMMHESAHAYLQIVMERGTDFKPTRMKGADESSFDEEEVMCFVEMQVNNKIYISPIADQGSTPGWDWPFYFPVEGVPAGTGCSNSIRFVAYNFLAREQPQVRPSTHLL